MSDTLEEYPRGQVSMGAGDLRHCSNATLKTSNSAKVVHMLRASGITRGRMGCEISFECKIPKTGPERDFFAALKSGTPQQVRFKFPGGISRSATAVVGEMTEGVTVDDGVNVSVSLVGVPD